VREKVNGRSGRVRRAVGLAGRKRAAALQESQGQVDDKRGRMRYYWAAETRGKRTRACRVSDVRCKVVAPMRKGRRFVPLLLLTLLLTACHPLAAETARLQPLRGGWEYRWGDSPFDGDGTPRWSREAAAADGWRPLDFPSNPPGRQGRSNLWLRVRLPQVSYRDPRLFVYSVDLITEVYLEGRRIYAFGRFDASGRGSFRGWPWHLISLPPGYEGKELYFRVFSDYRDIGLWGEVLLGSGFDQIQRLLRRDTVRLVVALASLALSLIFLLVFLLRREHRLSLYLFLVTLALVLRVLAQTHLKQLVIDAPLLLEYIEAASYFVLPTFVILFLREFLGRRYRRLLTIVAAAVMLLVSVMLLACLVGLFRLPEAYLLFDALFIALTLFLGVLSVKAALGGNAEARLVSLNFVLVGVLAGYSVLVSNGLLPWSDERDYLLLFLFSLGLTALLIRRLVLFYRRLEHYARRVGVQSEQLRVLNQSLEQKVAERTRQLELANRRLREEKVTLQISSITDGLTGLYNRTYTLERLEQELAEARRYDKSLAVVMFDLDHFKRVNDSYGHQTGDLAMQRVTAIFKGVIRESDLAGRYGGEEFLIVLPETDCAEATLVAERIRAQVESLEWAEPELRVTISGGVAEFGGESGDQLLQRADALLYRAKQLGRNRIVTQADLHPRLVNRAT
jgi:diguanylate cyclase (GGDEF)-like protein